MFINIILVVIGGGLGSASRYLFSLLATRWFGSNFSWGTLGVNLIGCFVIGFAFSLAGRNILSPNARLFFMTGFLGGLTTFSTYMLESTNFFRGKEIVLAFGNIAANNLGGLALVLIGLWLGRLV
ncbi:MAG: fluoride efflux transporter CrcB [Firmicutes bacterium]|nr:fluoride efflux transporter CrcB [Bacillota bacterium]